MGGIRQPRGWNTIGLAILVGQVPAGGALIGFDGRSSTRVLAPVASRFSPYSAVTTDIDLIAAAAHMAEEVRNASFTVPWMMVLSIILNTSLVSP